MADLTDDIIRDCCECERPSKGDADTVELRVSDLRLILDRHIAAQQPSTYSGETVADRLDAMADAQPSGSQAASDLYAAATVWRKHLKGPQQPSQGAEPAGVVHEMWEAATGKTSAQVELYAPLPGGTLLYPAPQPSRQALEPLTEAEAWDLGPGDEATWTYQDVQYFAAKVVGRFCEKHGLELRAPAAQGGRA